MITSWFRPIQFPFFLIWGFKILWISRLEKGKIISLILPDFQVCWESWTAYTMNINGTENKQYTENNENKMFSH